MESEIGRDDFDYFRSVIRQLSGIALSDAKRKLVQSRLRSRVHALGYHGYSEYRDYLESLSQGDEEWQQLINCLTTNKTDWFRESAHFDFLIEEFLPQWRKIGKEKLSVWCAASSTGEEPYSVAMVLNRHLGSKYSFEILATDIDTEVIQFARNGVYPVSKLEEIPKEYRSEAFSLGVAEIAGWMKIKRALKDRIDFQQFNLSHTPYPWEGRFDLILCRNVFIYFHRELIQLVVDQLFRAASANATLLISHSESLQNIPFTWKFIKPSIFVKGFGEA